MTPEPAGAPPPTNAMASGYRAALYSHGARLACKVAGVLVLARLVSPADHGLFAMAASVTLLLTLFRDFGMGVAAVQARDLSEAQKAALGRLHLWLGFALMALTVAVSPAVASFFGEPRLIALLAVMSSSFVLNGANAWPRTLLNRDLRFTEVNRVETLGAVAGTAAMIGGGFIGAGAYAFAAFLLVSELTMLLAIWRLGHWRPTASPDWAGLRPLAQVGFHVTGYNALLYALQQADTVAMGRWFGAGPLGFYNRAGQLLLLPVTHLATPFTNVLLATLSRGHASAAEFARQFREGTNAIAHLGLPLAVMCLVLPDEIVWLVLGRNWPDAAPLLTWLAVSAATVILTTSSYALCVTTGHASRLVQLTTAALLVTLTGLAIGRHWGPVGIAAGVGLSNALLLVPRLYWSAHDTPVGLRDFVQAYLGPIGVAILLAGALTAARRLTTDAAMLQRILIEGASGTVTLAAAAALWPRARHEFHQLLTYVRFPARSAVGPTAASRRAP